MLFFIVLRIRGLLFLFFLGVNISIDRLKKLHFKRVLTMGDIKMKKYLFFFLSLLFLNGNNVNANVNLHEVAKGQIEVTDKNILDFFTSEIKSALPAENSDNKGLNKKIFDENKKLLDSFKNDLPENVTAVSLIKMIDKQFSPLVKKITGIKFTVNKIKKDNDKFVITLDYEIKSQQFLKWLG